MKVKSVLLMGLTTIIMTACGDSVSVPQDPVVETCSGCGEWIQTIPPTCTT